MRYLTSLALGAVALLAAPAALGSEFIGEQKCKLCHKLQHASWKQTAHAGAFDKLKPEDRGKAECLKCHATGERAELPGVQCEACHGAGSEYKSLKVMKERETAVAAGLVLGGEPTCRQCHDNVPHEARVFDYAAMKADGVHAHKPAE